MAEVTPIGLANDRLMMLVDDSGKFITQRTHPSLALIDVAMNHQGISLSTDSQGQLNIHSGSFQTNQQQVEVWGDICQANQASNEINQWFSEFLGFSASLVAYQENKPRPVDKDYAQAGDNVSFADGFPLLVISQSSLDDLNSRLVEPVTMRNFRPNLVVKGCEAYAEDSWQQIKVGEIIFDAVKPCSRCVLTTVNPKTGIKREDKEPLKTLSQYRRAPGGVMFGMNLIPRSTGRIELGNKVEILA